MIFETIWYEQQNRITKPYHSSKGCLAMAIWKQTFFWKWNLRKTFTFMEKLMLKDVYIRMFLPYVNVLFGDVLEKIYTNILLVLTKP